MIKAVFIISSGLGLSALVVNPAKTFRFNAGHSGSIGAIHAKPDPVGTPVPGPDSEAEADPVGTPVPGPDFQFVESEVSQPDPPSAAQLIALPPSGLYIMSSVADWSEY